MTQQNRQMTTATVFDEIKKTRGYTQDKALYQSWGISKQTFSTWKKRKRLPIDAGIKIALLENISLDWMYIGWNSMRGHVTVNTKADEIARMLACLGESKKAAILAFIQSLANVEPYKQENPKCLEDMKLTLMDFIADHLRDSHEGAFRAAAFEIGRNVGVVHWIFERQHDRFSLEELTSIADHIAIKKGKKIRILID